MKTPTSTSSLPTDEALGLIQELVRGLPPVSGVKPNHVFTIAARRGPGEPLGLDCRAIKLTIDLNRGNGPTDFATKIRELMEVLAWLARCPGCSVIDNLSLWQRIVEMIVGTGHHRPSAASLTFGDPTTFPRWIISFKPEFGDQRNPRAPTKVSGFESNRRFIEELFARSPSSPLAKDVPSAPYIAAISRMRESVEQHDSLFSRRPEISVGIELDCGNSSDRRRYFEEMRVFIQGLRQRASSAMVPSSSDHCDVRLDSLGLAMTDRPVPIEFMDEMRVLHKVLLENRDLRISKIVANARSLEFGSHAAESEHSLMITRLRQEYGAILDHFLRDDRVAEERTTVSNIQLAGYMGVWQASLVCAALRASAKPIDHFTLHGAHGIPFAELYWVAYGLFHRSSVARVRLVELSCGTSLGVGEVGRLLACDRPGTILIGEQLDGDRQKEFDFPLVGTHARLSSGTFALRVDYLRSREIPRFVDVAYSEEPHFEVLATSTEWIGILVPGYGFGWVMRANVERIWTESIAAGHTHDVQELVIRSNGCSKLPILLREMGGSLRSLAIRHIGHQGSISEETVDEIVRACPNVTTLEMPSIRLNPLVQAYKDGRCAVTSLAIENSSGENQGDIFGFLEMLRDCKHIGAKTLQQLAFTYQKSDALPADAALDVVTQVMLRSAKLRVFFLVEPKEQDHLNVDLQPFSSDWNKTHPLVALLSTRGTLGDVVQRLYQDEWANVLDFMGPNRTIRVLSGRIEHCTL